MSIPMPETIMHGKVVGRFIQGVDDSLDVDLLPDIVPIVGMVTFMPVTRLMKETGATPPTTFARPVMTASIGATGLLTSPAGDVGIKLITGGYKVSYELDGVTIPSHDIVVLSSHTDAVPLDLTLAIPPGGALMSASEYAELVSRVSVIETAQAAVVAAQASAAASAASAAATSATLTGAVGAAATAAAAQASAAAEASATAAAAAQAAAVAAAGAVAPYDAGNLSIGILPELRLPPRLSAATLVADFANKASETNARTPTIHAASHGSGGSDPVMFTQASVGLGNVDNTADTAKPVSIAQQAALDLKQKTVALTTTGTGAATFTPGTGALNVPISVAGASSADVQVFTASGTWTKPAGAKSVLITCIGAGGGGHLGGGAHGGGGGAFNQQMFMASALGATESVVVAAGGAGGVSLYGSDAGMTSIGNLLTAGGGGAGASLNGYGGGGGVSGSGTGATAGGGKPWPDYTGASAGNAIGGQGPITMKCGEYGGGGGGGGGSIHGGGGGGNAVSTGVGEAGGANGAYVLNTGSPGSTAANVAPVAVASRSGSGRANHGGGGGSANARGANGGIPGGGGGGSVSTGPGGDGGRGEVIVTTYF